MIGRLPSCTARDVDRALKRAGLVVAQAIVIMRIRTPGGSSRPCQYTPVTLRDPLLKTIIRDAGLTEDEFRELL